MSNLKNNPSEPVDINDIYLAVFHRLGIDNVESLRDPKNVEIEAIVADIEAKAKRRIADSPAWQDILDALNVGTMPPKDEPQPPKAASASATSQRSPSVPVSHYGSHAGHCGKKMGKPARGSN